MVTTILVMTNFAMFKYKYGLIGTFVDSSNANTDKTILVIVMIFCITIIVAVKFQIAHPHQGGLCSYLLSVVMFCLW